MTIQTHHIENLSTFDSVQSTDLILTSDFCLLTALKIQNEPNFPPFQSKNKDYQKNEPNSNPKYGTVACGQATLGCGPFLQNKANFFYPNLCNLRNLWFQVVQNKPNLNNFLISENL
jgi:hypothetical protein